MADYVLSWQKADPRATAGWYFVPMALALAERGGDVSPTVRSLGREACRPS